MFSWVSVCRGAALGIVLSLVGATAVSAQSLPAPWAGRNIGSPAIPGSATVTGSDSIAVKTSGADVWGTSDQLFFEYIAITGDVDVRARVDSIEGTAAWAKVGVMIRASLAANSAQAFALASYSKGLAFQRRPVTGGSSVHTGGELTTAPRWVRLTRAGNAVTAYSSANGATWSTIGTDTIELGETVYVGIGATSGNASVAGTDSVSQISMSRPSTLPEGQSSADIGSPAVPGSASFIDGTYTITAAGVDIWGSSDQFHYVYQQASGDIDVKVRIASISYADRWSKAGVMIRSSLDASAAHAMMAASAGRGYAFQRRDTDGGLSVNTAGSTAAPPGWVRLKRSGSLVTAYQSTDGVNWVTVGSDAIALGDQVYVGIAATSHIVSAATTVKADSFSVLETAAPPPNAPPAVSLATNGTTFTAPASIALTATASDPEGQLARVEFYNGSTLLATDTSAPYAFTWSGAAAGSYALRAVAYDASGASASSTVNVTVSAATTSSTVKLAFTTTAADRTIATEYVLEFFAATANPATATAIKRQSLGKPAIDATGTATVDITTVYKSLAAGNYVATVSLIYPGGVARSATLAVTK